MRVCVHAACNNTLYPTAAIHAQGWIRSSKRPDFATSQTPSFLSTDNERLERDKAGYRKGGLKKNLSQKISGIFRMDTEGVSRRAARLEVEIRSTHAF